MPTPQQSYQLEYRCSPTSGRVWQERIPITPPAANNHAYHLEWRIHPTSGQTYQVEVPTVYESNVSRYADSSYEKRHDKCNQHSQGFSPLVSHEQPTPGILRQQTQSRMDNSTFHTELSGINRIDKSNNRRQSRVVDLARLCPVKWAKSTNSSNINLPLYTWGAISELESSLSGRSKPLRDGELLGKLRHLKSTVEVCCLNSTSNDFNSYGWAIAKDYALKVEEEVAQNLIDWNEMQHGVRTSSLVLAQMDCSRQSYQKSKGKDSEKEKVLCTTYNRCTTKGKCEYEVAHPDKTCQRKHECSWCRANLGQSYKHQSSECNKKKDASGSA